MKRLFIAGLMGLAFAGCAHSRSEVTKAPDGTTPAGPVAVQTVPSIHETINRGTGGSALAQSALGDASDPRWSGFAPAPGASRSGSGGPAPPSQATQSPRMAAADPSAATYLNARGNQAAPAAPAEQPGAPNLVGGASGTEDKLNPTPPLDAAASAAAATLPAAASSGPSPLANPSTSAAASSAAPAGPSPGTAVPYTLERPGGPMPEMLSRPAPSPSSPVGAPADAKAAPGLIPDGPPGLDAAGPVGPAPAANGLDPVGTPPSAAAVAAAPIRPGSPTTDPAAKPSDRQPGPARGATVSRPRPSSDPLLGPNPDLMPELPPLPEVGSKPKAAANPAASPATAAPAPSSGTGGLPPMMPPTGPADPPALPQSAGDGLPAPPSSNGPPPANPSAPPELGPPSADNRPGGAGPPAVAVELADLPPLEPVPSANPISGGKLRQAVASDESPLAGRRGNSLHDGKIVRTSLQKTATPEREPAALSSRRQATMTAAKVGDEIITLRDLKAELTEHCKRRNIPFESLNRVDKNNFCSGFMKEMINQRLLIQEAKRIIKSPKMYEKFTQEADHFWQEDQLPQLQVEFAAENEQQLREKFKEHGRSVETLCAMTKRSFMAENFLRAKLKDKVKAELPELLKYYNDHIHDKEFDRPAQITWREIVVEIGPKASHEAARKKIEALHQALDRGTDFAALARAQSEGPSHSREQGGLMQTSPGSYGVASVNEALQSLPVGQVSGILEGPASFHIVRVEGRRSAGPAPFEELQDQIRSTILEKKFQQERAAYLRKLWDETLVTTYLD